MSSKKAGPDNSIFRSMRKQCLLALLSISILFSVSAPLSVCAAVESTDEISLGTTTAAEQLMIDQRLQIPVATNEIQGWPTGPAIAAESAIVMDATTGTVLYGKNIHEQLYPASTTKMMTCLLAAENLNLDDTVTVTQDILDTIPADGSNAGLKAGDYLSVKEALYAIMVASANEVASAVAVKMAGSVEAFADMMNERAVSLGCTETHFSNANGLFADDHYTSAHDLAMIARAFFNNQVMSEIGNTPSYHFTSSAGQSEDFTVINKHQLINGTIPFSGIIGGKTGFLNLAGETLVTGAQRSGMRLICVVMKEKDPSQFTDTVTLLDYGFDSFSQKNIKACDTSLSMSMPKFMSEGVDILGNSEPALSVSSSAVVDLPSDSDFSSLSSKIGEDDTIEYVFGGEENGTVVGTASLIPASADLITEYEKEDKSAVSEFFSLFVTKGIRDTIYINVMPCIILLIAMTLLICFIINASARISAASYERKRRRQRSRYRRDTGHTDYYENHKYDREYYNDYDSYHSDSYDRYDSYDSYGRGDDDRY